MPSKGTKYVARASSNISDSVPVVIAVRDMLKLASTSAEVKRMVHNRQLKINGRTVHDIHQSLNLFSIFEADKKYVLTILPTLKFSFEPSKLNERLCKVVSRRLVSSGKIQLNLHDGTNIIGKENVKKGDSIYLDSSNKVKSHKPLEKGASVFISSGKYAGSSGLVTSYEGSFVNVKLKKEEALLPLKNIFVQ